MSISRSEETCGRDVEGRQREETAEGEEGRELSELSRRGGTAEGEERRTRSKLSSRSELGETSARNLERRWRGGTAEGEERRTRLKLSSRSELEETGVETAESEERCPSKESRRVGKFKFGEALKPRRTERGEGRGLERAVRMALGKR